MPVEKKKKWKLTVSCGLFNTTWAAQNHCSASIFFSILSISIALGSSQQIYPLIFVLGLFIDGLGLL